MKSEPEIRQKMDEIKQDWDNANDIWRHGGSNPQVGAIIETLKWVLDE